MEFHIRDIRYESRHLFPSIALMFFIGIIRFIIDAPFYTENCYDFFFLSPMKHPQVFGTIY